MGVSLENLADYRDVGSLLKYARKCYWDVYLAGIESELFYGRMST